MEELSNVSLRVPRSLDPQDVEDHMNRHSHVTTVALGVFAALAGTTMTVVGLIIEAPVLLLTGIITLAASMIMLGSTGGHSSRTHVVHHDTCIMEPAPRWWHVNRYFGRPRFNFFPGFFGYNRRMPRPPPVVVMGGPRLPVVVPPGQPEIRDPRRQFPGTDILVDTVPQRPVARPLPAEVAEIRDPRRQFPGTGILVDTAPRVVAARPLPTEVAEIRDPRRQFPGTGILVDTAPQRPVERPAPAATFDRGDRGRQILGTAGTISRFRDPAPTTEARPPAFGFGGGGRQAATASLFSSAAHSTTAARPTGLNFGGGSRPPAFGLGAGGRQFVG